MSPRPHPRVRLWRAPAQVWEAVKRAVDKTTFSEVGRDVGVRYETVRRFCYRGNCSRRVLGLFKAWAKSQ